ncbi:tyrosine recombinase XerC [Amycolatopsis thailandensis]|uniref:site-specific integrase n=1 Tax=Amycolatopsis thailandensis TaxID=589330 RepID=UPI0036564655
MPRKPLPLGSHGDIRLYGYRDNLWIPKGDLPERIRLPRWRAVTNYRGFNGQTRQIERTGTSATDATDRLRRHVAELNAMHAVASVSPTSALTITEADPADLSNVDRYLLTLIPQLTLGAPLSITSRVADGIPTYLARVKDECTVRTVDRYISTLRTHVVPQLGRLLYTECTVNRLQLFDSGLVSHRRVKPKNGKTKQAATKLTPRSRQVVREVVRGLMQVAVDEGILDHNPVKSMRRIKGGAQNPARALPAETVPAFFAAVDNDQRAVDQDLSAIIRALFGLGTRIGETLAITWRYVNLSDAPIRRTAFEGTPDESHRTIPPRYIWINGNITEPDLAPRYRAPVKTKRSNRVVAIPDFLYLLLTLRKSADASDDEPVFLNPGPDTWRSPKRVSDAVCALRERIGIPGLKTHTGRKTASTVLYNNGFRDTDLSDQFGHATADFTRSNYVDPAPANPEAAVVLDRAYSEEP